MTSLADPPDPLAALAREIARANSTLASVQVTVAAHRAQITQLTGRVDGAGLDTLAARFEGLADRVEEALDAAAPKGPSAPRWDGIDADQRTAQLRWLRSWVDGVLRPGYVAGGSYTLRDCWDQHEQALWELGLVAAWWGYIFSRVRARPDTVLALEWHDRWLPGAMHRLDQATRQCDMGHEAD
jgi:hypothetical protein